MFLNKYGSGRSAGEFGAVAYHCVGSDTTPGIRNYVLQIPTVRPGILCYGYQLCKYSHRINALVRLLLK